jgi:dienelactone hydrolase
LRECVVRIDDGRGPVLVAVLSERDPPADGGDLPVARRGLVLLPTDDRRRVGPHRLWVPWARQRAARGDVVLRLDPAGVGDSAREPVPPGDTRTDAQRAGDVARAVAWLQREAAVGACIVVSIGGGARHAWRAVAEGADLQRVVAVDPPLSSRSVAGVPPAGAGAGRALRLCTGTATRLLQRPFEAELARAADRGIAVDLVLCGELQGAAGRRARALLRDGRMIASHLPSARPGLAAAADRQALYARLDALIRAQEAGIAPIASDAAAWRCAIRPTPASEALRLIARASGAAP